MWLALITSGSQDGVAVSHVRREIQESETAESNSPDNFGKYPVFAVEGANHAQVSSGECCQFAVEMEML